MRIALATCSNLPGWEKDDEPFHAALKDQGIAFSLLSWDDPAVDWSSYDGCLIRTTWDYMERPEEFLGWSRRVESQIPLWNSARVLEWNLNKGYLADLEAAGVEIAPTVWLETGTAPDIAAIMDEKGWQKGFLKPQIGACARETLRLTSDESREAQAHVERYSRPSHVSALSGSRDPRRDFDLLFRWRALHAVQKIQFPGTTA